MNLNEAKQIINTKYKTYQRATDIVEIQVNKLLNINNFYYIALTPFNGKLILTDIAESANILYDITEDQWKALCKKYGVAFNDWHLETEFKTLADLDRFIALLDEASNM